MDDHTVYDLGPQPIAGLMDELGLKPGDLVANSLEQITFKMISRAAKGRRLTPRVKQKILNALNKASSGHYQLADLFNY